MIFNPDAEEFIPKAEEEHLRREERMGTPWREERLGIAWVSKHLDCEDESVGVWAGWDG